MKTYFQNESDYFTNQETLGHREMFIGIVAKNYAFHSNNGIKFDENNKVLVMLTNTQVKISLL